MIVGAAVGAVVAIALVTLIVSAHRLRTVTRFTVLAASAATPAAPLAAAALTAVLAVFAGIGGAFGRLTLLDRLAVVDRFAFAYFVVAGARQFRTRTIALVPATGAYPLDFAIGGVQFVVGLDQHREAITLFDVGQGVALLVEQVERHVGRYADDHLARAAADTFFLDGAQCVQRRRFDRADAAGAGAVRADLGRVLEQGRPQPLARHLEQAKGRDAADLDACTIVAHRILDLVLDLALVARLLHVDEVDHDQTGKIAQADLAGDFLGGLEVGAERRLLDVALLGRATRVDVDGDQRLGRIDDDVAAGAQLHDRRMHGVELAFHLIPVEERNRVLVGLDLARLMRHELAHELGGGLEAGLALDQHLGDVGVVDVA